MNTMARLDELLVDHDMSLYALSKASGINYSTFDAAKKREGQLSLDTIEKVCDTFGIPVYEFFMTDKDWSDLEAYILRGRKA